MGGLLNKNNKQYSTTLRMVGGEQVSPLVLAPRVSPSGVSPKKVGDVIMEETSSCWKGVRICVRIKIVNREVFVEVLPSTSSLLVRFLSFNSGRRMSVKKVDWEDKSNVKALLEISSTLMAKSFARKRGGLISEAIGTLEACGVKFEGVLEL